MDKLNYVVGPHSFVNGRTLSYKEYNNSRVLEPPTDQNEMHAGMQKIMITIIIIITVRLNKIIINNILSGQE